MNTVRARQQRPRRQLRERLAAFDRHRDDLLAILQTACERKPKTKTFDNEKSWRVLQFMARAYLEEEARNEERRMLAPAADRELLNRLGTVLGEGRSKLDEVMQHNVRGRLFLAWCEAHGDPDLTDPVMGLFDANFVKAVGGVLAGLGALELAAIHAAQQFRQGPGRPDGTSVLSHEFIVNLEATYRNITGKRCGAGGPFARFTKTFFEALGRHSAQQTVIDAIKYAKRRASSRWGKPLLAK
jgi:hypothetical protein